MYELKAVPSFEIFTPSSLTELISFLRETDGSPVLYAGGTDLMPMMKRGKIKPIKVIDISGLSELNYIIHKNNQFRVGALVTIQDFATSSVIPERYLSIKWLTKYFGAETTRNMATVGGNVVSGGERDIPAILTSLDGSVVIMGPDGKRSSNPLETQLSPSEIVTEIAFDDWGPDSVSWFTKFEKRASNGIGVVTAAVAMKLVDGRVSKLRTVLNRVDGRKVGRLHELENELTDKILTETIIKTAVEKHVSKIKPASDFRASSEFRKHVSKVILTRGIIHCWEFLVSRSNA
ncbi:MAG: FAD binding domain-containing protein [Candidatus Caldarchaeum sp.]|uniref:FAD-binding PCMH-type domain-containing protein n=1 Tax=Caldiarchaeum subterraneum TaxID=311458 RepID=A0A7C5UA53_CALS0